MTLDYDGWVKRAAQRIRDNAEEDARIMVYAIWKMSPSSPHGPLPDPNPMPHFKLWGRR